MIDFLHYIDVDYDRTPCTSECQESNDYCRCTQIYNARVTDIDINTIRAGIINTYYGNRELSNIEEYCIDRILVIEKIWEPSSWTIDICGGYYGEEIRSITYDNLGLIFNKIERILNLKNDLKKINFILELEYGYLLEDLKNKKYKIIDIKKSDLIFSQREYIKKLEAQKYYKEYKLPRGIVIKNNKKYRLIDGYHRCLSTNDKIIKVIEGY